MVIRRGLPTGGVASAPVRSLLAAVGQGVAGLIAMGLVLVFIGLEVGASPTRKDCPTPQGRSTRTGTSSGSFPDPVSIPAVGHGCAVDTGTRVVKNAIGLFPFSDNPGHIAEKSAQGSSEGQGTTYYTPVSTR